MIMQNSDNKIALITGGSKGIGFGIAVKLLENNMKVAITSRSQGNVDEAVSRLQQMGRGEAMGIVADVRDLRSQQNAVAQVLDKWGTLDLVVANAGLGHFASIVDMTPDQWHETIDTNLTGVFYSVKASLEALKASKGYIITISSLAGTNFFANGSAYNASKFALTGFTQSIMLDLRNLGIRVTTIMPGSVATQFNHAHANPDDSWKIQKEDIGQMVVDLMRMDPRTLVSKLEVRPTMPPK
jgi:3-oxoacyl-[acyl-carrier protein] reductase